MIIKIACVLKYREVDTFSLNILLNCSISTKNRWTIMPFIILQIMARLISFKENLVSSITIRITVLVSTFRSSRSYHSNHYGSLGVRSIRTVKINVEVQMLHRFSVINQNDTLQLENNSNRISRQRE